MATFTDDFNRANGAIGANWTALTGSASVSSNAMVVGSASTQVIWASECATADQFAQVTLAAPTTSANGVVVRCDGTLNNQYMARRALGSVELFKFVGGATTSLGSVAGTYPAGTVLRLEAAGAAIRLLVDGSPIIAVTDTDLTAGRRVGIRNTASTTGGTYDNFSGGDLPPPAQTVTNGRTSSRNSRRNRSFRR